MLKILRLAMNKSLWEWKRCLWHSWILLAYRRFAFYMTSIIHHQKKPNVIHFPALFSIHSGCEKCCRDFRWSKLIREKWQTSRANCTKLEPFVCRLTVSTTTSDEMEKYHISALFRPFLARFHFGDAILCGKLLPRLNLQWIQCDKSIAIEC